MNIEQLCGHLMVNIGVFCTQYKVISDFYINISQCDEKLISCYHTEKFKFELINPFENLRCFFITICNVSKYAVKHV